MKGLHPTLPAFGLERETVVVATEGATCESHHGNRPLDPVLSAFPFDGPVPRRLLVDRDAELATLRRRAASRVNVRIVAPRGFGTTSVLRALAAGLEGEAWRVVHVDLARVANITDVVRRIAEAYARIAAGAIDPKPVDLLARAGVRVSADGTTLQLGPRPVVVDIPAAEAALEWLLELTVAACARDERSTVVIFDEFHEVLVPRRSLDGLLRTQLQRHQAAAVYVFAGSEPAMMRELFERGSPSFYCDADPLVLPPLAVDRLLMELSTRLRAVGLNGGDALPELVALGAGHPQRTMLMVNLLATRLTSGARPSSSLADAVVEAAIGRTRASHQAVWDELRARDRALLAAVADGVAPTSRVLANEHGLSPGRLGVAAQQLEDHGHLRRLGRHAQLVDPLLAEWLRRR